MPGHGSINTEEAPAPKETPSRAPVEAAAAHVDEPDVFWRRFYVQKKHKVTKNKNSVAGLKHSGGSIMLWCRCIVQIPKTSPCEGSNEPQNTSELVSDRINQENLTKFSVLMKIHGR